MRIDLQTLARVLARKGIITEADLQQDAARDEAVTFAPAAALAHATANAAIRNEQLDDETIARLAPLYDPWSAGEPVSIGDLRSWDGTIVECLQAHTTQADWTPDATPALWKIYRTTTGATPDEWAQPTGAHDAYNTGDRVTFEGSVYESLIDGNVWSPTAYPAGWLLIE